MIDISITRTVYLVWFNPFDVECSGVYPALQGIWEDKKDIPSLYKDDEAYTIEDVRVK